MLTDYSRCLLGYILASSHLKLNVFNREKSWLFLDWTIFFPNLPHFNKWHWYLAPKTWEFSLISPSPSSSSVTLPMHFFFYYIPQRYFTSLYLFSISTATISVHTVIISSWSTETVSCLVTLLPFLHSYNLFSTQNLQGSVKPLNQIV